MKRKLAFFLVIVAGVLGLYGQGKTFKYYNLDRIDTIKGTIAEIKTQQSYHKHQFVVITLNVPETRRPYHVEVCPQWFFQLDLMVGMEIEATGSITESQDEKIMMSRSLRYSGEIHYFRDKNGFPLWRGQRRARGQGKGAQHRRQGRR
jgi:hypothetical protein